jgi:hypothetical protein
MTPPSLKNYLHPRSHKSAISLRMGALFSFVQIYFESCFSYHGLVGIFNFRLEKHPFAGQ